MKLDDWLEISRGEEPDWVEEAELWLKRNDTPENEEQAAPVEIIRGLLEIMADEGVI